MSITQRNKGARIEREIVHLHQDAGIPAEKISRARYTGPDLKIADQFLAEVKARKTGEGFKQLEAWLGDEAALLFLRRNRATPLVCVRWETYVSLLRTFLQNETLSAPSDAQAPPTGRQR